MLGFNNNHMRENNDREHNGSSQHQALTNERQPRDIPGLMGAYGSSNMAAP